MSLNCVRVALHGMQKVSAVRTRAILSHFETEVHDCKAPNCSCSSCIDLASFSESPLHFFRSQIRACKYSKFCRRFCVQVKLLALGLYFKSPSAYHFMSRSFRLPTVCTLQSFIGGFNIRGGFKMDYVDELTKLVKSTSNHERYCFDIRWDSTESQTAV